MHPVLARLLSVFGDTARDKAVSTLEWEATELQHVFALLVLGQFTGMPAPPPEIALGLLPDMEEELRLLLSRIDLANDPLSRLFSEFGVE
jgi:hypothetical protein